MNSAALLRASRDQDREQPELHSQLAVLAELEASLAVGRKALLALDIEGVRQSTAEQVLLIPNIVSAFHLDAASAGIAQESVGRKRRSSLLCCAESAANLNQTAKRILDAARIQRALLTRLQCKLRILSRALTGPGVSYEPPTVARVTDSQPQKRRGSDSWGA
jgi:hypothetical protein